MEQFLTDNQWLILLTVLWTLPWKGIALWQSARREEKCETPTTVNSYDVQNIMTHEAGHWLMLLDLYQWKTQKLTMYGYGAMGELQKRTLGLGDELGIDRIY